MAAGPGIHNVREESSKAQVEWKQDKQDRCVLD